MPERKFRQPHFEEKFAQLGQGSEARLAQVISAGEAESIRRQLAEDIVILDKPLGTFFERLKEDLTKIIKPVGGKVAVPATFVVLAIAVACGSGEKDKSEDVGGSETFSNNLPVELFDACREYAEADERGGADDAQGFSIAFNYFEDNPTDPKALYLSSIGSAFLLEIDAAVLGFEKAIEMGLPPRQKELAEEMIRGVDDFYASGDVEPAFDAILEPIANFYIDLKNNICPTNEEVSKVPDQTQDGQVQEAFDFKAIFDCAVNGEYPDFVDCQNELIDGGSETISPLLHEMLFGNIELKRDSSFWVFGEDARILSEIGKNYPQEVEKAVYKIIEVTECLTVNQCNEVVVGDELINLEDTTIVSELGKNAVNSLVSVGNYPGIGHDIAVKEFSRIQQIQDWIDQERDKDPYSTNLININNKLKEFIFHFNE